MTILRFIYFACDQIYLNEHILFSVADYYILPMAVQKISTGVKIIMPSGCYARIAERSSLALSCIRVAGRLYFKL